MRRGIEESDLLTAHPIGEMLPAIYLEDDLLQRFVAGLDGVLAPVMCTLDSLDATLDPRTAPDDLLDYVAGWLGTELGRSWSAARRRRSVLHATRLYRWRGTARGVRASVALALDLPDELLGDGSAETAARPSVEVLESGAARWSREPGADLPGSEEPLLVVRVLGVDLTEIDRRRLDALVAATKPAHVPHRVEFGPSSQPEEPAPPGDPPDMGQ